MNRILTYELDNGLHDSFDSAYAEAPILPDTRRRITSTSNIPFKYICKLELGSTGICTGTLIARNKVLTAAHCVKRHGVLRAGSTIRVIPGKRAAGRSRSAEPFGSAMGRSVHVPSGHNVAGDAFDYAVITLATSIGDRVGWWRRVAAWTDQRVRARNANIAGFPVDLHPNGDHMYWTYNSFSRVSGPRMEYFHDTAGGMSGSPLWIRWRNTRTIVGVHSDRDDPSTPAVANIGVHITPTILQDIQRMVALP